MDQKNLSNITNQLAMIALSSLLKQKQIAIIQVAVEHIHNLEQENSNLIAEIKELKLSLKTFEYELQNWEISNSKGTQS